MQICLGISDKKNGMPIMIARNDRTTNLRNGDVGVFYDKKIWFPLGESTEIPELDEETKKLLGKYARVSFVSYEEVQLPEHENAFAMTIHKSQGSGYDNVFLFLPEKDNPILTRELVYTGITRTQRNCIVIAPRTILEEAVKRKTSRWTGLDTLLDSSMECKDEGGEEAVQSAP